MDDQSHPLAGDEGELQISYPVVDEATYFGPGAIQLLITSSGAAHPYEIGVTAVVQLIG